MTEEEKTIDIVPSDTSLPKKITRMDFEKNANSKKGIILSWIRSCIYILISSFLISFAAYSLIAPNDFTIGGASGIAILLNVVTNGKIPQSITLFAINLPLVILSFFFVKKKFALLSAMNIGLQSVWLALFEIIIPEFKIVFGSSGEKIFAAIASGLCIGLAIALAFKVGGSTGGADIVAVMIQRKFAANSIARMLLLINCTIIGSSVFVFHSETLAETLLPIMMSAFESYIESKTNESVTNGFHSAIEFRIITKKPEEMSRALLTELQRGVTAIPAVGMYTKEKSTMLFCVVSRRQVVALKRITKAIDPDSFAVMVTVSQVLGLGFYTDELSK